MKTLSVVILLFFAGSYARAQTADTICHLDGLPFIHFTRLNKKLDKEARQRLDSVAALLKLNPACGVVVGLWEKGDWFGRGPNYLMLSWYRTKAIVDYLHKKNIDESRLTFAHNEDDSLNDVKLRPLPINDVLFHPTLRIKQPSKPFRVDSSSIKTLKDSDGDGIIDQFDLEPHTPANAEVDTHGRAVDTDGDGVPDYLDKEKLTLAICLPVNKDGVGYCPDPWCCSREAVFGEAWYYCPLPKIISPIIFLNNNLNLKDSTKALLDSLTRLLRNGASCSLKITPYYPVGERENAKQLQLCWDEAYTIITYLKNAGVASRNLIFAQSRPGNTNSVSLEAVNERGLYILPPPYPILSQIKGLPVKKIKAEYEALKKSQQ